jgi:signal transduction histidine kinase
MRLVDSEERAAVIVCRADPIFHGRVRALLAESVPMLAAMFDRERLIARAVEIERSMSEARDRRLARLGLDVHDGPLQDLAALGQDIGLFRRQLDMALDGSERRQVLLGRIDDLEAQLIAADAEIRRLAVSLQSPFLAHHDFRRALEEVTTAFEVAAGLTPQVALTGELGAISDSQQMALLTIVREALGNVREHSGATEVQVSVAVDADAVRAELWDNGTGFDVETTLVRAARSGRLGLVGMLERVRLLDGTSRLDSRPGGPTTLSISLPRWQQ